MKKIIALALALIMALSMGVVALAADYKPGEKFYLVATDFISEKDGTTLLSAIGGTNVNKTQFKLEYKFETGNTLVDSVKIIDSTKPGTTNNNSVEVALKESYTMNKDKALVGTITLVAKETVPTAWAKGEKFTAKIGTTATPKTINNGVVPVYGAKKVDSADVVNGPVGDTVYVCDEDSKGYVKFDYSAVNDLVVTLNMKANEKVYMGLVANTNEDYKDLVAELEDKYEDATLQVIQFEAAPKFANEATFELADYYFDSDATVYNYVDGKLIKIDTKWDDEEDVLSWTADEVGTLVISDVEIVAAAEEETKNPDTGANDVVGVAAALAVVSLVAAGAVSLKK